MEFLRAPSWHRSASSAGPRSRANEPRERGVVIVIKIPRLSWLLPNILDRYISRIYLRTAALSFAALLGIFYIATFIDRSDKLFKGQATHGTFLALSPDGRLLATGMESPTSVVQLWEVLTGKSTFLVCGLHHPLINADVEKIIQNVTALVGFAAQEHIDFALWKDYRFGESVKIEAHDPRDLLIDFSDTS